MTLDQRCTSCDKIYRGNNSDGQWWNCNNYFKITGFFCPTCYNAISHDAYRKPNDPEGYLIMLIKLGQTAAA